MKVDINDNTNHTRKTFDISDIAYDKDIQHAILACGSVREPRAFALNAADTFQSICPFDQALVFFFNGDGKLCDQHLLSADEHWVSMYRSYYAHTEDQRFNISKPGSGREIPGRIVISVRDWTKEDQTEFIIQHVQAKKLKYTCSFGLHDMDGRRRVNFALDRIYQKNFTEQELLRLALILAHLNNLYKNFYYQRRSSLSAMRQSAWASANLSEREAQVANLLCQGVSPANISRTLYISPTTTNKHIAHIYKKMQVSSKQELLVKLLNPQE